LPITQYRQMLSQGMNLANLLRGGEFQMQTEDEEQATALADLKRLIDEGRAPAWLLKKN
jgi:hypothetical protein